MRKLLVTIALVALVVPGVAAGQDGTTEDEFENATQSSVAGVSVYATDTFDVNVQTNGSIVRTVELTGDGYLYVPENVNVVTGTSFFNSEREGITEIETNDSNEYWAIEVNGTETFTFTSQFDDTGFVDGPINVSDVGNIGVPEFVETVKVNEDQIDVDLDAGEDLPVADTEVNVSEISNGTFVEQPEQDTTNITVADYNRRNVTFLVENTNNVSTSFYVEEETLLDAFDEESLSGVELKIDGEEVPYFATTVNNTTYVTYTIDHFSTREVTFTQPDAELAATGGGNAVLFGLSFVELTLVMFGAFLLFGATIYLYDQRE